MCTRLDAAYKDSWFGDDPTTGKNGDVLDCPSVQVKIGAESKKRRVWGSLHYEDGNESWDVPAGLWCKRRIFFQAIFLSGAGRFGLCTNPFYDIFSGGESRGAGRFGKDRHQRRCSKCRIYSFNGGNHE